MKTDSQDLVGAAAQMTEMHDQGALSDASFYQCLTTLASSWLCNHQDAEQALILLNRCPPEYFNTTIVEQMRADHLFAASTVELGYRLVQLGIAGEVETPTQNGAQA